VPEALSEQPSPAPEPARRRVGPPDRVSLGLIPPLREEDLLTAPQEGPSTASGATQKSRLDPVGPAFWVALSFFVAFTLFSAFGGWSWVLRLESSPAPAPPGLRMESNHALKGPPADPPY